MMNFRRNLPLLLLLFLISFVSAEPARIGYVKGMQAVPFAFMISDTNTFEFTDFSSAEQLVEAICNGSIDAANLPLNIALMLYEITGGKIVCVSSVQDSNFFIVSLKSNDENDIVPLSSFVGRDIHVAGSGFSKDLFLWLLFKNEIPVGQGDNGIKLSFERKESSAVSLLLNGKASCAVLSEPAVSAALKQSRSLKIAVDLQDSYSSVSGTGRRLPVNVLVVRREFAENRYDSLLILVQRLESSVMQISRNPKRAAARVAEYNLGIHSSVAGNAVRRANFNYRNAKQCQTDINNYIEIHNLNSAEQPLSYPDKNFFFQ